MNIRFVMATLVASALALPAAAAPMAFPTSSGLHGQGGVVAVAAKKKPKPKPKKRQVQRNPLNGDVLIGRVDGFHHHERTDVRRAREGNDLGGLLGQAVNNFMLNGVPRGRHTRRTGPNEIPDGGYGQTCGPQYWTSTPTSPAC